MNFTKKDAAEYPGTTKKGNFVGRLSQRLQVCTIFPEQASSQSRDTNSGSFDSVMSYKLRYSTEGVTWTFYQQNGIDKVVLRYIYSNKVVTAACRLSFS